MRTDFLLFGIAAALVLLMVGVAVTVPGFLAAPADDEPPARLDVTETTLTAGEITAETATLDVTAYVTHRGGSADNTTVVVRATDADSGLVADTTEVDLGTLDGDREHEVPASVTVPRDGDYEIRTLLYVDDERVDVARTEVRGVGALTPPHAASTVAFRQSPFFPAVEYRILEADGDTATLDVSSYLTNGGDAPEDDLSLVVTARQADSGVVADRTRVSVGAIGQGRTATVETTLEVPEGYNYYLDATLWRDGVIIAETRSVANLDPSEVLDANETRERIEFEAGDFETERTPAPRAEADETAVDGDQPGFGVGVAVVAILGGLLAVRRWSA
ncbi:MAG: PGF-CTERM sorting domain-containing protein [Natronomonas sp.]